VISFDLENHTFNRILGPNTTQQTQNLSAICTFIDQQSILWVGHLEGLTKLSLDPGIVHHIDRKEFSESPQNQVSLIAPMNYGNGSILLGSGDGIWEYTATEQRLNRFDDLEKIVGNSIWEIIAESDSTNLIISRNGLYRIVNQGQGFKE